ncbi:acyl-CoA thioesterase [Variovorax saccharolyticus]|uniref:acyl-CoA thioesterase n=1 Tax=Variovorax saccharolyticus TaxID=3053516 RepID=UPI002577E5E2|nr:hotdog domain-containing protein [Variovorax sp. J31P216]MDM0026684.1 hotdog domain-containing protein [Variovorax sp. J31P216]
MSQPDGAAIESPAAPEIVLRVIPMPADTSMENFISGGWVMSKLDAAGSVLPLRISRRRVALVAVDELVFAHPILLGDLVTFHATVTSVGMTSITVQVEATTERRGGGGSTKVTECRMTYVALDDERRPVSVR